MKKILFYFRGVYNGGTEMESYILLTKLKNNYDNKLITIECAFSISSNRIMQRGLFLIFSNTLS